MGNKIKKILCMCNHGNVRSAGMARLIKALNGACIGFDEEYLKDYIRNEAIAIGAHCSSKETLKTMIDWADIIVDLSDEGSVIRFKEFIKEKKYIRFDVGGDVWGNPMHPDLSKKLNKKIGEICYGE